MLPIGLMESPFSNKCWANLDFQLENTKIYNLLLHHTIEGYFHYADDLIVYNENRTNINDALGCFNKLMPKLKFTLKREKDHRNNFLDIAIYREYHKLSVDIYRKPTSTNTIIPNNSCHPREHKMAAIGYFYNRMNTYQLSPENMLKESKIIQKILTNKSYNTSIARNLSLKKKQ
jgi:hypothetical protein